MKRIQDVMAGFGAQVGLPDLSLDDGNCCTLQFDDVVVNVEYLPDSDELYLYSRVGSIPGNEARRLQAFTRLLESNCFYRGTSGGVLGVDAAQDAVVYTNKVGADGLDADAFGEYMEAFVNLAEGFARDLLDESGAGANGGDDLDPSMAAMRV